MSCIAINSGDSSTDGSRRMGLKLACLEDRIRDFVFLSHLSVSLSCLASGTGFLKRAFHEKGIAQSGVEVVRPPP